MTVVLQLIAATLLIAAFILLRVTADRLVFRSRLRHRLLTSDGEDTGCVHSCDKDNDHRDCSTQGL